MIRLLLARHGETAWNDERRYQGHIDIPLNAAGEKQAAALARRLAAFEPLHAIYSSDLIRAQATAQPVASVKHLELHLDPRLRELNLGKIEGLTFTEAEKQYPVIIQNWLNNYDKPPPGGETFSELTARIQTFLTDMAEKHVDQTVLVVAHGGTLSAILRLALKLPPEGHWYFKLANASLSELHIYNEQPLLVYLNSTRHLNEVK